MPNTDNLQADFPPNTTVLTIPVIAEKLRHLSKQLTACELSLKIAAYADALTTLAAPLNAAQLPSPEPPIQRHRVTGQVMIRPEVPSEPLTCPKCGTELQRSWLNCPKCEGPARSEPIEAEQWLSKRYDRYGNPLALTGDIQVSAQELIRMLEEYANER